MKDEDIAKRIAADRMKTWLDPRLMVTVSVEELLRRAALDGLAWGRRR